MNGCPRKFSHIKSKAEGFKLYAHIQPPVDFFKLEKYIKNFDSMYQGGWGLLITGPAQSGKTTWLAYLLKSIEHDWPDSTIHYITAEDLFAEYLTSLETKRFGQLNALGACSLLLVDDLGAPSPGAKNAIIKVLARRLDAALPTVFASTLHYEDLCKWYGEKLTSFNANSTKLSCFSPELAFRLKALKEKQDKRLC